MKLKLDRDIQIWLWAITKSRFDLCRVEFYFPLYFFWHRYCGEFGIGYQRPRLSLDIPYSVKKHFNNRDNPNFVPDFDEIEDDIPF